MNNLKIGIVGGGIQGISNALFLQKKGFDVDYLEIVNANTLKKITVSDSEILIAIAANFKGVRLIDNIYLELPFS